MDNKKHVIFNLLAGIITIFVFLTGIHSIPSLFGKTNSTPALFEVGLGQTFPATILIISQVVYYLSYYGILRFIHTYFFESKNLDFNKSPDFFFIIIFFILGCGISLAFVEGFWGPLPKLVNRADDASALFLLISFFGNGITVSNGLRCKL